jgi:hypothetical protein
VVSRIEPDPQLPEWVQTLIEAEKEKAYDKGREDGYRYAVQHMRRVLENNVAGY